MYDPVTMDPPAVDAAHPPFGDRVKIESGGDHFNARIYVADGNQYFNRPGPRAVEPLEILAELCHPGLFKRAQPVDRSGLRVTGDSDRDLWSSSLDEESDEGVLEKIDDVFQDWSTNDLADPFIVDVLVHQRRARD